MIQQFSRQIGVLIAIALAGTCTTTPKVKVWKSKATSEEISFPIGQKIFFADDNTLYALGEGESPEGLRTPRQKEATAKEAARMDSQSNIIEHCIPHPSHIGIPDCCSMTVTNYSLDGYNAESKKFRGKVFASECTNESPQTGKIACNVVMKVQMENLRQVCEERRNRLRDY